MATGLIEAGSLWLGPRVERKPRCSGELLKERDGAETENVLSVPLCL